MTGLKYRSTLTGRTVRIIEKRGDIVVVVTDEGNREYIHVRDFNATYRAVVRRLSA